MLKQYHHKPDKIENQARFATLLVNSVINEDNKDIDNTRVIAPEIKSSSTFKEYFISDMISDDQKHQQLQVMEYYKEIFSVLPGKTNLIQNNIQLML